MKKQLMFVATAVSLALSGINVATAGPVELGSQVETITQKQSNNLFNGQSNSGSLKGNPLLNTLLDDASIMSAQSIGVNPNMISGEQSSITVNLGPGLVFKAQNNKSYWLNSDYQVWTGDINTGSELSSFGFGNTKTNLNSVVFVRNGDRVFGEMKIDGRTFGIQTTDDGQHILTEIDLSKIPLGDDTPRRTGNPILSGGDIFGASSAVGNADVANAVGPNGSTIRVLQTATNAAINDLGGVGPTVDRMNFFLAQSNDVYARNGLDIELQDAGRFRVGQAERRFMDQNLDGLANPNDGFADTFAGATRNSRTADIVTIITATQDSTFGFALCGIADAIAANASQGFFAISSAQGCANGFTFVHELAHLFGARHDNDPTTTPFSFGHGFVNAGANIRTIMAVNSNPQQRVGLFSTDDQTFNGSIIGNSTVADNERVHEVRRQTMASFR